MSEDHPYAVAPSREMQNIYWQVVDKTLRDVFCGTEEAYREARDRLEELRGRLEKLEGRQQGTKGKLFQTEPLTVAGDLAGQGDRALTPEEVHRYLQIKREFPQMDVSEMPTLVEIRSRFEE